MKNYYKTANFLALISIIIAGFSSITIRPKTAFSLAPTNDTPILSPVATASPTLPKVQPITGTTFANIAATAKISQPVRTTPTTTYASTPTATCSSYYGHITIGNRTICLASTGTTSGSLSYNHAYIYSGDRYIFGHNSANLFGPLASLPVGTNFSLTIQGSTTHYRISLKEVACDYTNPAYPCANYPEPVLNMSDAVNPSRRGAQLAIMTCAGTAIGNGDATHRLTVYATRI